MKELDENEKAIIECEAIIEKAESRVSVLDNFKQLELLYKGRLKLIHEDDSLGPEVSLYNDGFYMAKIKTLKLVIASLEKL